MPCDAYEARRHRYIFVAESANGKVASMTKALQMRESSTFGARFVNSEESDTRFLCSANA